MEEQKFKLDNDRLKQIVMSLHDKVLNGLREENTEIQCIPTYITPKTTGVEGKALVLDLGGTNYRAAVVDFQNGQPEISPANGWKKDLSVMKTDGYTKEQLFKEMADLISEIEEKELPVGFCFSYPAESLLNGDANLIRWTKGVTIGEMIGRPVGQDFVDYLNTLERTRYTGAKVINDTVASLFAGLSDSSYDAYIGLIVGTGTNMATFIPAEKIEKLNPAFEGKGLIPVNFESGNFHPPFLTDIDEVVDSQSENIGCQRFEKAVSGMYLGEVLKATFPDDDFQENFDARMLTLMLSHSDIYKEKYVRVARSIYERSACLVAASLAGLIKVLISYIPDMKRICLTAEGSLFWSQDKNGIDYKDMMMNKLQELLSEYGLADVQVDVKHIHNANLIGSAIAALS